MTAARDMVGNSRRFPAYGRCTELQAPLISADSVQHLAQRVHKPHCIRLVLAAPDRLAHIAGLRPPSRALEVRASTLRECGQPGPDRNSQIGLRRQLRPAVSQELRRIERGLSDEAVGVDR
jgi:hypothetical protein